MNDGTTSACSWRRPVRSSAAAAEPDRDAAELATLWKHWNNEFGDSLRKMLPSCRTIRPWPELFRLESAHLRSCLPSDLIVRIEHFGSTAVPGLAAKPIIGILLEVTDLEATKKLVVPVLESQQYEYLWRPTRGDDGPPFYAWFIKRHPVTGVRTHHIHMVERQFSEHWERLLFRDYLVQHPETAKAYEALKLQLASAHPNDRVAYTRGKTDFIREVTELAKRQMPQ